MGIGSLGTNYIAPMWQGTRSASRHYLHFVLGVDQSTKFSEELTKSVRGVKDPVTKKRVGGKGFKEFKKSVKEAWAKSEKIVAGKSFWGGVGKSFKSMPSEFEAAARLARMTGQKSKFIGSTFKIIGKRMPFIANAVMLAMEVPNLYRAFTQGGVGTGIKEIGKVGVKFGGFAAGAAIGQALIPIPVVGALIGGFVGGWLAEKIVGKSFTEKKEEAEANAINQTEQVQPEQTQQIQTTAPETQNPSFTGNINPFQFNSTSSNPFNKQDYMDQDFMAMSAGLIR